MRDTVRARADALRSLRGPRAPPRPHRRNGGAPGTAPAGPRRGGLIRASALKGPVPSLPGPAWFTGTGASSGAAVDLALELHRELGLKPWHPSIFAVGSIGEVDEECNSLDDPYRLKNWLMVRDIRRRLVEET